MTDTGIKKNSKFRIFLNVLILIQYFILLFLISSSFSFMPWYDADLNNSVIYLVIWIPLCVTTLALVISNIATKHIYRARITLLCFNALFVPLTFLIGYVGTEWLKIVLCVITFLTILAYVVSFIRSVKQGTV